ncbi:hypothetical protein ACFQ2B_17190 [Streptomyces stramineus]
MQIATCVRAVAGGWPFQTVSTRVSTETMRPGFSSSSAIIVRCRAPYGYPATVHGHCQGTQDIEPELFPHNFPELIDCAANSAQTKITLHARPGTHTS